MLPRAFKQDQTGYAARVSIYMYMCLADVVKHVCDGYIAYIYTQVVFIARCMHACASKVCICGDIEVCTCS